MTLGSVLFTLCGWWLLFYRFFFLLNPLRLGAEIMMTILGGASLALLAPCLPWPPPPFGVLTLAIVGVLLSSCGFFFPAIVLAITLGVGTGGFAWQLGACSVLGEVPYTHGILLTTMSIFMVLLFVCIPGTAGPGPMKVVLAPCLGALLFTVGLAGLLPEFKIGLTPSDLLAEEPCEPGMADGGRRLKGLAAWALLSSCGIATQLVFIKLASRIEDQNGEDKGSLAAHLLPQGSRSEEDGAHIPRPGECGEEGKKSYSTIAQAISAPEGADLSHLTENERKIVEICRTDEEERDRILWGGGLL
eukprot:TRINITY_DN103977_c0_g1_i1.p1 TRINITY_DN103977_c0_g1~~TRINITY_DN103977_c0_g1_i1.p1  ORF type:complete len:303 (+),score=53.18 TRINITY_DN103977_c0_g1_i1:82-990(+)